jgi:hypothetical protein
MGLLTCGRCGRSMTAEKKKGKYVYYRCTSHRGTCGNAYIREEVERAHDVHLRGVQAFRRGDRGAD